MIKELHETKGYPIQVMCEILKLNRSSYYKWLNRKETDKEILDQELSQIILEFHRDLKGILGYRRMTIWINRLCQTNYNKKKIRRLMRKLGVSSVIRRKRNTYKRTTPEIKAENVLNREFKAEAPKQKWLTDVTEFRIMGSSVKLYLSAIIDLYDKSIVSYKVGRSNNNELVFRTFDEAIKHNPLAKPLVHSDRGYQYTSPAFRKILELMGATQSMSRVSRCIDNGPMEGFWGTIKSEMYYITKFNSFKELEETIHKYIYFYNNERYQLKTKGLTPIEYRNQALA